VAAGANAFANIDHMVVLNGAEGVSDLFTKALSLGGTGLGLARQLMEAMQAPTGESAAKPRVSGTEVAEPTR